jgi:hypothetical protein
MAKQSLSESQLADHLREALRRIGCPTSLMITVFPEQTRAANWSATIGGESVVPTQCQAAFEILVDRLRGMFDLLEG